MLSDIHTAKFSDGDMFVNLETTVLSELVKAGGGEKWTAVTIAFLRFHERDAAVARLAEAIRWYVCDQASHPDPVTAEFYRHALTRAVLRAPSLRRALLQCSH